MIFFTSDLHLFHENIINICHRPFSNLSEMHEAFIEKWNSVVLKNNDDVFIIGDLFCDKTRRYSEHYDILKRLRGRKHLIFGNHDDKRFYRDYNPSTVTIIRDIYEFVFRRSDDNRRQLVVLSHYPLLEWNKSFRGSWHLHGHSHKLTDHDNRGGRLAYNVAADLNNFTPISLSDIEQIMISKE